MKYAVVTLTIGKQFEKLAEITHPTIRKYADKINAEFIILNGDSKKYKINHYYKLGLRELLDKYDRILFLDTDILVREDAPNIFEVVQPDELGIFEEGRYTPRVEAMQEFMQMAGYDLKQWDGKYYNTGVMVLSKEHRYIFNPPSQEIDNFKEQTYINLMISYLKPKVHILHHMYNHMSLMQPVIGEERYNSYFMHYAGADVENDVQSLIELMGKDLQVWKTSAPAYKYKRNIAIMVEGGLGDQVCAEPTVRYAKEVLYKEDNVIAVTHYPSIFSHLDIPAHSHSDIVESPQKYCKLHTMRTPEHESWKYMTHALIHPVDFASIQALRQQLPFSYRRPVLSVKKLDKKSILNKVDLSSTVLVHAGKHWPSKTFPADVWQSYIDAMTDSGISVAVIGKDIDDTVGVVKLDTSCCLDLVDKLNLNELFYTISKAPVLISNDSSPVHIASAFDNWIGLIATCKNPDLLLPCRWGVLPYSWGEPGSKTRSLQSKSGKVLWTSFDSAPTCIYGSTMDKCTEEHLRECLPEVDVVLHWVKSCLKADSPKTWAS